MRKNIIKFTLALAVSAIALSCQKEALQNEAATDETTIREDIAAGRLISACKSGSMKVGDALGALKDVTDSSFSEILKASVFGKDIVDFEIVTYKIRYSSVVREGGVLRPAVLTGSVSFIDNRAGFTMERELESVSLINTIYNTSALDVTAFLQYFNLRTIYNALVVFPHYQGGDTTDGCVPAPSEFLMKGRQAIDCELAALEFVESLENVSMDEDYYTENYGISNGGGPALSVQYLLENDDEYSKHSDKINLRSTYVGEGNCSNASLFPYLLKKYEYSEDSMVNMNNLAAIGYISTVAGTYVTWGDKYFSGIQLEDYFSEEFLEYRDSTTGKNLLEQYLANEGSLMYEAFKEDCDNPSILETVNPALLVLNPEDSTYSFNMENGSIINNMYDAFTENEPILSGWEPESPLVIAHSLADEFLIYKTNFKIWSDLSHWGCNDDVHMETAFTLEHLNASIHFMGKDVLLSKHVE